MKMLTRARRTFFCQLLLLLAAIGLNATTVRAADHGDAPNASNDQSADINDVYFFLDPTDNNKVILAMTTRGFIVPSEAVNFGIFDPKVVYRFLIEGTGDTVPDATIDVTYSPRVSNTAGQNATVKFIQGGNTVFQFTAPATAPATTPTSPARIVTTDPASGVGFFGGLVDDPFTFDIVGFNRFVASVLAGTPDGSHLNRGRDSFAGYNTMVTALSIPKTRLPNANNVIGVYGTTLRADVDGLVGNLSTRGEVEGGENVLIAGVIITGTAPKRVLIRGIGPSLGAKGVQNPLQDPTLSLVDSNSTVLASNDDWQATQQAEITATTLAPTNPKEAAILTTLAPGAYTAVLSGVNNGTGVALHEVYDLDASTGGLRVVDRMATPAVNVALIPFARKNEYNLGTPVDDAAGKFANSIVGTLQALGTNEQNINILASIAVANGDYLRLNLNTANSGPGGGNNSGAGFPNGRRLVDDVVDTELFFIANQTPLTDNANVNDVPLTDTFPFFGLSQQPRDAGVIDDNTRN